VLPREATARLFGLVFDDSGSMQHYIHSPTFGVQLLLSTLDGRDGQDRVFSTRLSQIVSAFGQGDTLRVPVEGVNPGNVQAWGATARSEVVTEHRMTTQEMHQQTLGTIARTWPDARFSTPYEAIEVMLDRLSRDVREGEEAFLVVLSDGEFTKVPPPNQLRASYEAYRARFAAKRATLRVEFLLIAPSRPQLVQQVEQQRVRATLLELFNGAGDGSAGGRHDITDLRQLQDALKNIIARTWSIDRAQQARLITRAGPEIRFEAPLSISRIVTVSTATQPRAPTRLTAHPAGVVEERRLSSEMRVADTVPQLARQRLVGETVQLRFQPALSPGRHVVTFGSEVDDDSFLLFETAARVELTVERADGSEARRQGGAFVVARGEPHRLVARLLDGPAGSRPAVVELSTLPQRPIVSAALETPGGPRTLALGVEAGRSQASAALPLDRVGEIVARAQVRIEGLVSAPSEAVTIRVIEGAVGFSAEVLPAAPCTSCAPGEVGLTIAAAGALQDVATVQFVPAIPFAGLARLNLSGLPPGLEATWPDGSPVNPQQAIPIEPQRPVRIRIVSPDPARLGPATGFVLRILAEAPFEGEGVAGAKLRVAVPVARLVHTGHTGGDADTPLSLSAGNLRRGDTLLDFTLTEALSAPRPEEFDILSGPMFMRLHVSRVHGHTIQMRPEAGFLCLCLLRIGPEDRSLTLRWRQRSGLQTAEETARVRIAIETSDWVLSCAAIAGLLVLLAWLVLAMITAARTMRFPRGSIAEVKEGRQMPRYEDLRRRHCTLLRSLAPWHAMLLRSPHERVVLEGLEIEARRGGGQIRLSRSGSDFRIVRLGMTAKEMSVDNPRLSDLKVIWNDEIELLGPGRRRIRLLRAFSDHAGSYPAAAK
jgi:hypothetical protein